MLDKPIKLLCSYLICLLITSITTPSCIAQEETTDLNRLEIYKNQIELSKKHFNNADKLLEDGIISKKEYEMLKDKVKKSQQLYDYTKNKKVLTINETEISFIPVDSTTGKTKKLYHDSIIELYKRGIVSEKELFDAEIEHNSSLLRVNSFNNDNRITNINVIISKLPNPFNIILKTPLKYISSAYGYRRHPISNLYAMHNGVDIAAPGGVPIYAYADGIIKRNSTGIKSGNFVEINHPSGYSSLYLHLQRSIVKQNQFVKKGEVIGYVGSTGMSTGNHLHFEIRTNNIARDINKIFNTN